MKTIRTLFLSFFLLQFVFLHAQERGDDALSIELELRPRTEYDHGYGFPLRKYIIQDEYRNKGKLFTTQRTRLNLQFENMLISGKLSLQDVRKWGDEIQLVANEDYATSVHEAWAEINLTKKFIMGAGRTELIYDDGRILGNSNWQQQGRSHDLVLFKYDSDLNIHVGIAFNGYPYNGLNAYKSMQFIWLNSKYEDLEYSLFALNNGLRERGYWDIIVAEEKNVYSQLFGTRLVYTKGYWNLAFNGYFHRGKNPADWLDLNSLPEGETISDYNNANNTNLESGPEMGMQIAAFNFAFDIQYELSDYIDVSLGYEILSGNDLTDLNRTEENAFMPLYGSNHDFNGSLDYFYRGNHESNAGLQDIHLTIAVDYEDIYVKLHPHYFLPAGKGNYIDQNGETQEYSSFGTEIDLMAGYRILKDLASIELGYSHMIAAESFYGLKFGTVPNDNELGMNNWAWIQLNFNFQRDITY
jgi:hypothetical protein